MAVYEIEGPDGSVYEVEGPETGTAVSAAPEATTTTPTSRKMGPIERAGAYITKRGGEFLGAARRMVYPPSRTPESESLGGIVGDVATLAGPVLAGPVLAPAGLVAGAAGAAAGMETPEIAEAGAQIAGGLSAGVKGAVRGFRGAKEVISEGRRLREMVPGLRQTVSTEGGKLFDPIVAGLEKTGRSIVAGTQAGDDLLRGLTDALDVSKGAEKRIVTDLIEKFTAGQATGALRAPSLTVREIDDTLKALSQTGKGWTAKAALNRAMASLAKGTSMEGKLSAAQREYHRAIVPAQAIAKAVGNQKTPGGAAVTLIREWRKIAPESKQLLDPTGEIEALSKSASKGLKGAAALAGGIGAAGSVVFATQQLMQGDIRSAFGALLAGAPLLALRAPGAVGAGIQGFSRGLAPGVAGAIGAVAPGMAEGPSSSQNAPPIENAPVPGPSAAPKTPQGPLGREMGALSKLTGVPINLARLIMTRESSGNPAAVSEAGARGLMQIMPATFARYRGEVERLIGRPASIDDPLSNMTAGFLHLRDDLRATGGNVGAAAKRYFAGPDPRLHGPKAAQYGAAISRNYASLEGE